MQPLTLLGGTAVWFHMPMAYRTPKKMPGLLIDDVKLLKSQGKTGSLKKDWTALPRGGRGNRDCRSNSRHGIFGRVAGSDCRFSARVSGKRERIGLRLEKSEVASETRSF
ncbi:MAG: hypothetical protein JRI83_09720 [Deltaproteobacteria bacterium]|nr:hypothetical protein [Deltaproteobacteria bacterium]MBW2132137.1 hypothetical protein [Deltaproteobacteria bacterium]